MKHLKDYIANRFLLLLGVISRSLNILQRKRLGEFVGDILRLLSRSRSEVTLDNITKSLPELNKSQHIKIRNESYHNLGITLVELLAFPKLTEEDFRRYIHYENAELIKEVYNRGKGLIFLSGHFGNWELTAYVTGKMFDIPITIVVKPQSNKISDHYLNQFRTQGGNKIVPMSKAARSIVQTILNKGAVGLLVDQSADWRKDIFVDFFGRPAATYEAPAALALKYKCPIVIGFSHRQDDGTYKVIAEEIAINDLDDSKDSVAELTLRHVKILEKNIRINPGHWAWQHKRWKHDPPVKT